MFLKKDEQYYIKKGRECRNNEKYEDAINFYKKAIGINPNNYILYHLIGETYILIDDFENAITYYDKSINIKPNDILAYTQRGNLYRFLGKFDEANIDLSKAIDLLSNKTEVEISQNNYDKVSSKNLDLQNRLQNLINLDNEIKTEQMLLTYYYRGKNNIKLENNQVAVNDFNNVIEICDRNINLKNKYIEKYKKSLIFKGFLNINLENLKLALEDFNTFIKYEETELDFIF